MSRSDKRGNLARERLRGLAVPLGKVASPQAMTEGVTPPRDCFRRKQARQLPFAFTTPTREKGVQESPQTFLNPKI